MFLQRSVRVEGTVARVPEEESEEYFHTRCLTTPITTSTIPH